MRNFIIPIILIVALSSGDARAQQNTSPQNSQVTIRVTYDSEAITVADTAIGFTTATITPTCTDCPINTLQATLAVCSLETASIRILTDGTNPTSTVGFVVASGASFSVYGHTDIENFRAIRTTGTSGVLNCQYSRVP